MATLNMGVFRAAEITDEFIKEARASVESRGQTILWESGAIPYLNLGTCDSPQWGEHSTLLQGGPVYVLAFTRPDGK